MTSLILGTAQFGAGYGITNPVGRLDDGAVRDILALASKVGIDLFDTAPDYGDAQARLAALRPARSEPRYVSKFALPVDGAVTLPGLVGKSIDTLGVPGLYGALFHRVGDLRDSRAAAAWELLRAARAEGLVSNVGASIYDADDLSVIVERFPDLDLVQVPGNLVDRRLLDSAVLHRLHERGVEVHVRSAYLQGLLLSSTEAIPEQLAGLQPAIAALGAFAASVDRPVIEIALGYLKHHPVVDAVLVGALSAGELAATAAAWGSADEVTPDLDLPRIDPGLLDPRRWPPRGSA